MILFIIFVVKRTSVPIFFSKRLGKFVLAEKYHTKILKTFVIYI